MMNSNVDPLLSSTAPVFAGANIGSISDCTFQIFHGDVKIVQAEKKRRLIIESDDDDWPFFSQGSFSLFKLKLSF